MLTGEPVGLTVEELLHDVIEAAARQDISTLILARLACDAAGIPGPLVVEATERGKRQRARSQGEAAETRSLEWAGAS